MPNLSMLSDELGTEVCALVSLKLDHRPVQLACNWLRRWSSEGLKLISQRRQRMYCVGAVVDNRTSTTVVRYDPIDCIWEDMASIFPVERCAAAEATDIHQWQSGDVAGELWRDGCMTWDNISTVLFEGELYVIGFEIGWPYKKTPDPEALDWTRDDSIRFMRYCVGQNQWEALTSPEICTQRDHRCRVHDMLVLDGCLRAICTSDVDSAMRLVKQYSLALDQWIEVQSMPPPEGMYYASQFPGAHIAVLEGMLYAIGGIMETDDDEDDAFYYRSEWPASAMVQRYCSIEQRWSRVADMTTARIMAGVAVLQGKLYVLGGGSSFHMDGFALNHTSSVERYDPAQDCWETMADMLHCHSQAGVAVLDGRIHVAGGCGSTRACCCMERYDAEADTWERLADMPATRHAAMASQR